MANDHHIIAINIELEQDVCSCLRANVAIIYWFSGSSSFTGWDRYGVFNSNRTSLLTRLFERSLWNVSKWCLVSVSYFLISKTWHRKVPYLCICLGLSGYLVFNIHSKNERESLVESSPFLLCAWSRAFRVIGCLQLKFMMHIKNISRCIFLYLFPNCTVVEKTRHCGGLFWDPLENVVVVLWVGRERVVQLERECARVGSKTYKS